MYLRHKQKNYIKKNLNKKNTSQIAADLAIPQEHIIEYIEKKWGAEKVKKNIPSTYLNSSITSLYDLKNWIINNWPLFLLLFLLILVTFANATNNAFLSDDIAEIRDNPNISNFSYIFTHPFGFIRLLLNYLSYQFFGLAPFGFRLINFIFHAGNIFLIFAILNLLRVSKRIAFFSSAIFAVHPAISEAIVWISAGTYPQYSFFFLLSFFLYIFGQKANNIKFYLLAILFYLFAFMSHPVMPIALFLIFPLYEFIFGNLKKNWFKTLPFLGLSLAYVLVNLGVLSERQSTLQTITYQKGTVDNPFFVIITALSSYIEFTLWPKMLTFYHTEIDFSLVDFIFRATLTCGYFGLLIVTYLKNKKIFFYLSLFFIALLPTLSPFRLNWIVAERYLYLGILGLIIPTVFLLEKILSKSKVRYLSIFVFSLIVICLSIRTFTRNMDWKDADTLWLATDKVSPSSPANHLNLGDMYYRHNDFKTAIKEFNKAIDLKPDYGDAYHNMGNAYKELGQFDLALQSYQKALSLNPNIWPAYQNIAYIYFLDKKYDLAEQYIQKAIKLQPQKTELVYNLGLIYLKKQEKEKAKQIFQAILAQDPQNQVVREALRKANK